MIVKIVKFADELSTRMAKKIKKPVKAPAPSKSWGIVRLLKSNQFKYTLGLFLMILCGYMAVAFVSYISCYLSYIYKIVLLAWGLPFTRYLRAVAPPLPPPSEKDYEHAASTILFDPYRDLFGSLYGFCPN